MLLIQFVIGKGPLRPGQLPVEILTPAAAVPGQTIRPPVFTGAD